jgi:hypothetical protein
VYPHVKAERWKEPAGEQLDPLRLIEETRAWEQRLEMVLILLDGAGAATVRQFKEGGRTQRRTIAQIDQFFEPVPRWGTFVRLDLDVPQLCPIL